MEFDLRLQEYIELARARKTVEAIAYSKKHLLPWNETHHHQIVQAAALLCYPPTTSCGPYKVSHIPLDLSVCLSFCKAVVNHLPSNAVLALNTANLVTKIPK